jgi:hypothetical protein
MKIVFELASLVGQAGAVRYDIAVSWGCKAHWHAPAASGTRVTPLGYSTASLNPHENV